MNASGTAVGRDHNGAALWSSTGAETVLTTPDGWDSSSAHYVNAKGQSIGGAEIVNHQTGDPFDEAVSWSPTGAVTELEKLSGYSQSAALAINARGASVGECYNSNGQTAQTVACRWDPSGLVHSLAPILGSHWTQTSATGLDDRGDIIGTGLFDGAQAGFILHYLPNGAAHVAQV
jgi:uncharacterized membrane protein